jgi:hypothetical protein
VLLEPVPSRWDEQRILIAETGCGLPVQGAESTEAAHHNSGFAIMR